MSGHVAPKSLYYTIFASLMVLTLLTVAVAYVDLGMLNLPVALAIAVGKAMLVILFFMHIKYSSRLVQVTAFAGFVFLGILIFHTMSDYLARGMLGVPGR
jgi:cytochrome c oxidase subunit IV